MTREVKVAFLVKEKLQQRAFPSVQKVRRKRKKGG